MDKGQTKCFHNGKILIVNCFRNKNKECIVKYNTVNRKIFFILFD